MLEMWSEISIELNNKNKGTIFITMLFSNKMMLVNSEINKAETEETTFIRILLP